MIGITFVYPLYLWLLGLLPITASLAFLGRKSLSRGRFWGGLALRSLLLLLIILALSGIQIQLPSRMLTAVFLLDVSDSISSAEQARGEELIRAAVESMPDGDQAAIVVFGDDSLVERLASEDSSLSNLTSTPITTRTDIAGALQLGMALFPDEGARRLVLLSDGRENLSYAMQQAELAALQQIDLQYIPLGEQQGQVEVLVNSLDAPAGVREGQSFDLNVSIESTSAVGATLRVFADDQLIHTQEIVLRAGMNHYTVPVQDSQPGFRRFRAQIEPDADHRLQNNEASAFTVVHGPPNVLLVEGTPGDTENLSRALLAAGMEVTLLVPEDLPGTLPELAQYDAIVLANVPASRLPSGVMEALPIYVRDLGKGLLMTGGENSFGAGGYLRTPIEAAMPIYMDIKSRELAANLALIVAVDKSGSMGRCHCDNPDLNQTYTAMETGQSKVDIAKEAIMRSAGALGEQDYLGVVTFDNQARWVLQPQLLPGQNALENAIGTFNAQGQTNIFTGVNEAYKALQGINAKRKHIILMTDGWVRTGDLSQLTGQMREQGITLSIIAAGEGSAEYLQALAEAGGGRYYPAVDMMSVPDVFLKETVKSVGQYIIEEPFYPLPASPSPIFRGIDQNDLPGLLGYNGTSPKSTARMDLLTPRGDPLLASWQFGLGRTAVWTSDMQGRWAADWVKWSEFAQFSAQLVDWLLPAPQIEGLDAQISLTDAGAVIRVDAKDQDRPDNSLKIQAHLIDPELKTIEIELTQVGPGQYEAASRVDQPGTYLVWLGVSSQDEPVGQMTLGMVVPYSPEYRAGGINLSLLDELARVTGGGALEQPVQAFKHNLPALQSAREIWRALLLIAAILFPLDVALRRLVINRRDLQLAQTWLAGLATGRSRTTAQNRDAPVLGRLFSARERARQRIQQPDIQAKAEDLSLSPLPQGTTEQQTGANDPLTPDESLLTGAQTNPPQTADDAFSRLKEAKKRARR